MELSRAPNCVEDFFRWRNIYDGYSVFIVCAEFSRKLTKPLLFESLQNIIYKHPELYSQFYDEPISSTEKPEIKSVFNYTWDSFIDYLLTIPSKNEKKIQAKLKIIDSFQMKDVVEFLTAENIGTNQGLIDYISENIMIKKFEFNNNTPLWKISILNEKYAVFSCEHTLYDGNVGINIFKELKDELNKNFDAEIIHKGENESKENDEKLMNSKIFNSSNPEKKIQLPLDFTKVYPYIFKPDFSKVINALIQRYVPNFMKKVLHLLYSRIYAKLFRSDSKYTSRTFGAPMVWQNYQNKPKIWVDQVKVLNYTPEEVNTLVTVCRKNNVKLTSLLVVSCMMGIAPFADNKDIIFGIPVNLRRYATKEALKGHVLEDPNLVYGDLVGEVPTVFPSVVFNDGHNDSSENVDISSRTDVDWDIVNWIQNHIQQHAENVGANFGMLKYADVEENMKAGILRPKTISQKLSNLGIIKNKDEDAFKIVDLVFHQPTDN
ncbi:unnamed protein product [[Candida] boidinii]|nr:unnamed protein product [[Candida] boidinii]